MYKSWKHAMRTARVVGTLVLISLFVTSCLSGIFNRPPEPVIAIAEGNPYGPPPREITFDISGSSDPDGEIVSFTFDFADGSDPIEGTDLTQPITHTYLEKGLHFATLTVVDNTGTEAVAQTIISVFEPAE